MAYGKIFESLFTGSMIGAGPTQFAVWAYAIANSKPPGLIELNPRLLAAIIGTTVEDVRSAIETLCSPDPESRTKEHEGRRLIHDGAFTYTMPTWPKYNEIRNEIERREKNRQYQREHRERKRQQRKTSESDSQQCQPTEKDKKRDTRDGMDGWMDGGTAASQNGEPTPPTARTGGPETVGGAVKRLLSSFAGLDGPHEAIVGGPCPNTPLRPNVQHGGAQEPHECPFQTEAHDNRDFRCQCCDACTDECRMDT